MKQISSSKDGLKAQTKQKEAKEKELKELDEHINKIKGPFKTKFDALMDSLSLKRKVYYSGALVGNDIDKIFGNCSKKKT